MMLLFFSSSPCVFYFIRLCIMLISMKTIVVVNCNDTSEFLNQVLFPCTLFFSHKTQLLNHLPFTESNKQIKVDTLSDILSPPCCCCVSEKKIQLHKHHQGYANKHQGNGIIFHVDVCWLCVCMRVCACVWLHWHVCPYTWSIEIQYWALA